MITTPSSFARACMRSTVGPGIGSARSKRSASVTLQIYGALKSSWRQTIFAPRFAASRTHASAAATAAFASVGTADWTSAMESGTTGNYLLRDAPEAPRDALERGGRPLLEHLLRGRAAHADDHVHDVRAGEVGAQQRLRGVERRMRVVPGEIALGIAARVLDLLPRGAVDDRARGIGGAVASVGAAREERRAARALALAELARGGERQLLTAASRAVREIAERDGGLASPDETRPSRARGDRGRRRAACAGERDGAALSRRRGIAAERRAHDARLVAELLRLRDDGVERGAIARDDAPL